MTGERSAHTDGSSSCSGCGGEANRPPAYRPVVQTIRPPGHRCATSYPATRHARRSRSVPGAHGAVSGATPSAQRRGVRRAGDAARPHGGGGGSGIPPAPSGTSERRGTMIPATPARAALSALGALLLVGSSAGVAHGQTDTLSTTDETFLTSAHQSNLAEIAAGEDAQTSATTECVKEVGETLVIDHRRLDDSLTALAGRLNVALPDAPTPEQQQTLSDLAAVAGTPTYDEEWLRTEEAAHRATLELIDDEINGGENAEVIALAEAARPVVALHLEMVEGGRCDARPSGNVD
ncbi:hypothetical protein DEH69_09425 [Streptomyces sp. PT12]|nr:hypothetical protein DEH69_09425 [Streptomyces sp. PT12]